MKGLLGPQTKAQARQSWLKLKARRMPWVPCTVCHARAYLCDWSPPGGLDPRLRAYLCLCSEHTYARISASQLRYQLKLAA